MLVIPTASLSWPKKKKSNLCFIFSGIEGILAKILLILKHLDQELCWQQKEPQAFLFSAGVEVWNFRLCHLDKIVCVYIVSNSSFITVGGRRETRGITLFVMSNFLLK